MFFLSSKLILRIQGIFFFMKGMRSSKNLFNSRYTQNCTVNLIILYRYWDNEKKTFRGGNSYEEGSFYNFVGGVGVGGGLSQRKEFAHSIKGLLQLSPGVKY